jgi:hypothetical protein
MHRNINSSILCFSCYGYRGFDHPVECSCDDKSLQDIWIGIPYIIFAVPVLHRIIFEILRKHHYSNIIQNV